MLVVYLIYEIMFIFLSLAIVQGGLQAKDTRGGVLPYMAYTGMCRWTEYGFFPLCLRQGL